MRHQKLKRRTMGAHQVSLSSTRKEQPKLVSEMCTMLSGSLGLISSLHRRHVDVRITTPAQSEAHECCATWQDGRVCVVGGSCHLSQGQTM